MSVTAAFGFLLPYSMNFEDETEPSDSEKSDQRQYGPFSEMTFDPRNSSP